MTFLLGKEVPKDSFHIDSTSKNLQGQDNFVRPVFYRKQSIVSGLLGENRLSFEYCKAEKLLLYQERNEVVQEIFHLLEGPSTVVSASKGLLSLVLYNMRLMKEY